MKSDILKDKRFVLVLTIALMMAMIVILWAARIWNNTPVDEASVTFELENDVTFNCEVADNYTEMARGLMGREELAPDRGMLFVFDTPRNVSFWMKDTYIPLDIIFIDENGVVLNIAEANPEPGVDDADLTRHVSAGPVKWVLEINQGLSHEYGIVPGTGTTIMF